MRRNVVIGLVGAASGTGAQRLRLSVAFVLLVMTWSCTSDVPESPRSDFDVMEKSISELAEAMESGVVTSRMLVEMYLNRISAYDRKGPALRAMISINANALERAD